MDRTIWKASREPKRLACQRACPSSEAIWSAPRWRDPGWAPLRGLLVSVALWGPTAICQPADARIREAALVEGRFDSLADALEDAVQRFLPTSVAEDREHLGGIFTSTGPEPVFVYSVARNARGRDELRARLHTPAGFRLAAIWHTHGAAGHGREWFSPRDTRMAETLGVPVYLATPEGEVRVFHPGGRKLSAAQARRRRLGLRAGVARGAAVDPARLSAATLAGRRCSAEGAAPAS
jgi:hypothetical protein